MTTKPKTSAAMSRASEAHDHMLRTLFDSSQHCLCEPRKAFKELDSALVVVFREYANLREICEAYGIEVQK